MWLQSALSVNSVVLVIFMSAISVVWVFQVSRWRNLITSLWTTTVGQRNASKGGNVAPGQEPHVTVQICMYNESEVISLTVAHACSIDWPKDKLHVQVLDDSTDQESIDEVKATVSLWTKKGFDVQRLCRPDRVGYKAGNLRFNFDKIIGDYVAYFDADHRAEPDFLRNMMPYFFDKDGKAQEKIGLVQAPWAYYNTHQNIITECDALCLDVHHMTEELGRATNHKVFGFNGTGGIWLKQAVEDGGGFTWEAVTEDIHLSVQCHLKGYDFIYARHFPQLLEIPCTVLAQVQQKNRWTKGFIQVLRLRFWSICLAPGSSVVAKYEILLHLLSGLLMLANLLLTILYPFVMQSLSSTPSWLYLVALGSCMTSAVFEAVFASIAKVPGSNGHYSTLSSRVRRLGFVLPYLCVRCGLGIFDAKAILEGLFSNDLTFHVTPKVGLSSCPTTKAKLAAQVNRSAMDDTAAFLGIVVALSKSRAFVRLTEQQSTVDWLIHEIIRFWDVVICIGMLIVSVAFLWEKHFLFLSVHLRNINGAQLPKKKSSASD